MRDKILRILVMLASMVVLVAIGIIIGINIRTENCKPSFRLTGLHGWTMQKGYEGNMIEANFLSYVRASYILIGTYPDCEYYKIASGVPRNDYDTEQFYIEDDGDFMYYHDDNGNRVSTIAIDVSEFQANIEWDRLKDAGVDTVMIRAGYRGYGSGLLVEDSRFSERIAAATKVGLTVGVYFFTQAISYEEGAEEAEYVMNLVSDYNIKGPIAIDTEFLDVPEARTYNLDNETRTQSVVGFCETVRAAGYVPMIYSNRNWFATNLDMSVLGNYKLWLAQYANEPDFPYVYSGWQYTDQGVIDGVDGYVDLNVWFD